MFMKLSPKDTHTSHKQLYLWNNYRTKGVQFILSIFKQGLY